MPSSLAVSTPQHAARCLGVKTDILKPSKYINEYLDLKFNRADKILSFNADMNMSHNYCSYNILFVFSSPLHQNIVLFLSTFPSYYFSEGKFVHGFQIE